jgi:hypothetical protein
MELMCLLMITLPDAGAKKENYLRCWSEIFFEAF